MRSKSTSQLKIDLAGKNLTIGSWLQFGSGAATEMLAKSGFPWLVIDMEHTAISFGDAQVMMQAMAGSGCEPIVRVGGNSELLIKRSLDIGAHGVIVPMVTTAQEARAAVAAAHYPPVGTRGTGLYRAQGFGEDFEAYRDWSRNNVSVIVQIEHVRALENLEGILDVEGVDGFIVGPYDLSASLGRPGEFSHSEVRKAFDRIAEFVKKSRKAAGFHIVRADERSVKEKIGEGYSFLALGSDMIFLAERVAAMRKIAEGAKA